MKNQKWKSLSRTRQPKHSTGATEEETGNEGREVFIIAFEGT